MQSHRPAPCWSRCSAPRHVRASQKLAADLRNAGIRAELYLGNPKHGIGQQLKYADSAARPARSSRAPDEKAKGEVLIRT